MISQERIIEILRYYKIRNHDIYRIKVLWLIFKKINTDAANQIYFGLSVNAPIITPIFESLKRTTNINNFLKMIYMAPLEYTYEFQRKLQESVDAPFEDNNPFILSFTGLIENSTSNFTGLFSDSINYLDMHMNEPILNSYYELICYRPVPYKTVFDNILNTEMGLEYKKILLSNELLQFSNELVFSYNHLHPAFVSPDMKITLPQIINSVVHTSNKFGDSTLLALHAPKLEFFNSFILTTL